MTASPRPPKRLPKRSKFQQNIRKKTSVLVTGAGGFIGRAVAQILEQSGERALLLDVSPQNHPDAQHSQTIRCDITNVSELERVFSQQAIGGIIHLAAILPTAAQKEPFQATQVNLQGSLNLLEAARKFGVKRFVFGSSLSIYGSWPADHAVSEMDRAAPEDLYGAAKLLVEQLGRAYSSSHGLEFVSLRIGRVVGEGARSATSAWRSEIFEFLIKNRPVTITLPYVGSERILLVHVKDVARMLLTLLRAPRLTHAVYNAPCESVLVSDLKQWLETLNPKIEVQLGTGEAAGNPRQLARSRFQEEFGFAVSPISEQLKKAAKD